MTWLWLVVFVLGVLWLIFGLQIALISACVAVLVCPPQLDPAIKWKERNERRKGRWK